MKKLFFLFMVLLITTCSVLAQKKYAVLIVGDLSVRETNIPTSDLWKGDGTGEMDEFWNDTYLMWEMLQSKGFHSDSIFVLFGDGSDRHPENHRYNPGNVTITDRSATVANVRNLFEDLRYGTNNKPQITEDDFLFVWVFDHGGYYNGHSKIYLHNNGTMLDTVFAKLVNPIPAHRKAFWMQQCYGGGFADDLSAPNTVFISASQSNQSAYRADNRRFLGEYGEFISYIENELYNNKPYNHGEFNYHMISVINQESPSHQNNYGGEYYVDYDPNSDSIISMEEAPLPYWVDTIVTQPEGYYTDAEGNVEISSSDGLVWLISTVNGLNGCEPDDFEGRTVKLVNDIDFGNEGWNFCFSPIGTRSTPFLGTFDGDGHKIHHLRQKYSLYDTINNYYFDMGVFGYIRHATVKNVTLDSTCRIISSCDFPGYYRGGMVGFSDSLSVVDNIYIHTQGTKFDYGASLVGMNRNSIVRNCAFGGHDYNSAPTKEGGGLVSYNRSDGGIADAVVENCYFYGNITVSYNNPQYLAGLVSFNETMPNNNGKQAIVRNCHSTPTDSFGARCYGSLVAVISEGSSVRNCYTDLTKMYQYGRMIGLNEGGEFSDCCEYTNIDGIGTLALPVTINDTTTDNLLNALNLWITKQEHPELYRTWVIMNDSIPVFGDYYVGVPEHEASFHEVTIHPNPTNGIVRVEGATVAEIKVHNALGRLVKTAQSTNEIDLSALPKGVYLLKVTSTDGHVYVGKVALGK